MRKVYTIVKMRDRLQKQSVLEAFGTHLKVCPQNCKHNQEVNILGASGTTRVCGIHDPSSGSILICDQDKHASSCVAYEPKFKSEVEVVDHLLELYPTAEDKKKAFPHVALLEWVLDEDLNKVKENPPGLLARIIIWMQLRLDDLLRKVYKCKE